MNGPALRGLMEAGRGGDDTVGHLDTGEIVVPTMVLGRSPKVRGALERAFESAGLSLVDFTVGSGDINPATGLQEFEGDGDAGAGPGGGNAAGEGPGAGQGGSQGGGPGGPGGPGGEGGPSGPAGGDPSSGLGTGNNPSNPSGHSGLGAVGDNPGTNGVGGGNRGGFRGLSSSMVDAWNDDSPLAAATFGLAALSVNPMVGLVGATANAMGAEPSTPDGELGANAVGGNAASGGGVGSNNGGGAPSGGQQGAPGAALAAIPAPSVPVVPGRPSGPVRQGYWDGNRFVMPGLFG